MDSVRLTRLDDTVVGKQLARTFYNADGKALLRAGVTLTQEYVSSLRLMGFRSVYVNDEFTADIAVDDFIDETVRFRAVSAVKGIMEKYIAGEAVEQQEVKAVVDRLLNSIRGKKNLCAGLSALRSYDDYTYGHSVNVCLLAMVTGASLFYDTKKLYELGVGALMHDIGKMLIPLEILNKPLGLTSKETELMRRHTHNGFEILRKYVDISLLSAHVPYEHHEWYDGHGYPRGLKGEGIIEYARITAVADVFDAVTNDRIYRPRISMYQAYNLVSSQMGTHFDRRIALRFLERVQVFPNGTFVRLNTGEAGVIVRQAEKISAKPVVRLLTDRTGARLKKTPEINLWEKTDLDIVEVLEDGVPDLASV